MAIYKVVGGIRVIKTIMTDTSWSTDSSYLDRRVNVKLITGEALPDGIRFWGNSSIAEGVLWFGIPKADEVHKSEVEFHIPVSSIAYVRIDGG